MERKFKVGDRVIATDSTKGQFTKGNTYVVDRLNTYSLGVVADDAGSRNGWGYDCFKLADEGGIKVGDKVRVLHTDYEEIPVGSVALVHTVSEGGAELFCKELDCGLYFFAKEFELAPADAVVYGEESARPKFKVGDKVVDKRDPRYGFATVSAVHGDRIDVVWRGGHIGNWPASEFDIVESSSSANDNPVSDTATTAIVAVFTDGKPRPNARPYVHTSEASADGEARRLASLHPGQEFGVFVLKSKVVGEVTVKDVSAPAPTKWQELALAGKRIPAIKAYREAGGMTKSWLFGRADTVHAISLSEAVATVDEFIARRAA